MSQHSGSVSPLSEHPASPALLTSNGPQKTQAIRPASPQSFPRVTGTYRRRGTPEQKTARRSSLFGCTAPAVTILWATIRALTTLPYDVGSLKIGPETWSPEARSSLLVVGKVLLGIHSPLRSFPQRRRCESHSSITQWQLGFSYPEGNFEGNQLLGDSMSLSPLHQTPTNELHVSIETSFHRSFPRLRCILE